MKFLYDDGGRKDAGFSGNARDCVARSISIATGIPYGAVYGEINRLGSLERKSKNRKGKSHARTGVHNPTFKKYMNNLGWVWTPTMFVGQGCKIHLREEELPIGKLIVSVSKHITAVVDGVVHDTYDPSRDGSRCVYGYWKEPEIGEEG